MSQPFKPALAEEERRALERKLKLLWASEGIPVPSQAPFAEQFRAAKAFLADPMREYNDRLDRITREIGAAVDQRRAEERADLARLIAEAQAKQDAPETSGRKQSGPKPSGQRQDDAIRKAIDLKIAAGEIEDKRGEPARAARELQKQFPDYKIDTLVRKVSEALTTLRSKHG